MSEGGTSNEPEGVPPRVRHSSREREPKANQTDPEIERHEKKRKWDLLRRRYIESDMSLRALADQHDVPYATAKRRARTEKWRAKRKALQNELQRQLNRAVLVSRAEAHAIQERAARETVEIFRRVFAERTRALRADPAAKNAADSLSRLIQLQLDVCELALTIFGDTELDARAAATLVEDG